MSSASGTVDDLVHIASHTALLPQIAGTEPSARTLDALIVPTKRPGSLQPAIKLAAEIGCPLVVLCSAEEQAREVPVPEPADNVILTYVPPALADGQFTFRTSTHPDIEIEPTCHIDIARKRNLALLLARMCGWRTLMYLDDDIRGLTSSAVTHATQLIGAFRAASFKIEDFPDNSVICHAHRLAGAEQNVFPGGSALVADVSQSDSFFPPVYNEDWLFLFDAVQNRSLVTAGTLSQLAYDPFARPARATSEEFGDVIAEGLYRLVHERASVADATLDYWRLALDRRGQLIDDIATRLISRNPVDPVIGSALMSLAAARKRLAGITPVGCVSFIRAWQSDLSDWRSRLQTLPLLGDPRDAAKFLNLTIIDTKAAR